jgi:hypothetical protein
MNGNAPVMDGVVRPGPVAKACERLMKRASQVRAGGNAAQWISGIAGNFNLLSRPQSASLGIEGGLIYQSHRLPIGGRTDDPPP